MTNRSKQILFKARIKGVNEHAKIFDFYETPSWATSLMMETLNIPNNSNILEPCNGLSSISNVLKELGHQVTTLDINKDAQADKHVDFLTYNDTKSYDMIVTNPPFKFNRNWEFAEKALTLVREGGLVVMVDQFTKIEGQKRRIFYNKHPLYKVLIHSKRFNINGGVGIGYAWFVWKKGYIGDITLKLI